MSTRQTFSARKAARKATRARAALRRFTRLRFADDDLTTLHRIDRAIANKQMLTEARCSVALVRAGDPEGIPSSVLHLRVGGG